MALAVEAERRLAADDAGVALVKLEADGAGDVRLAMVDRRLQHLAFGREPEAVVDELGIFRHQLVLEVRSEEHTSELQSLMRISYAVFCLKKKNYTHATDTNRVNLSRIGQVNYGYHIH